MAPVYSTIVTGNNRIVHANQAPAKKSAPLTQEQLSEQKIKREEKQAIIDAAVSKWHEDTNELAQKLATQFDMQPRYFLDLFFQGGAHLVNKQAVVNPYNAFKSLKASELRDGMCTLVLKLYQYSPVSLSEGIAMNAPDIHRNFWAEYAAKSEQEKSDIVKQYSKLTTRVVSLRRDTPRARIQDVANISRNMKMLVRRRLSA